MLPLWSIEGNRERVSETLCGTMASDLSSDLSVQEDDAGEEEAEDMQVDLLERARRLCAAANEIALPMLQSVQELQQKFAARNDEKKSKETKRPRSRHQGNTVRYEGDDDDEEKRRERPERKIKSSTKKGPRDDSSKLPSLPLPPIGKPTEKKKPAVPKMKKKEVEQEEEPEIPLPLINATDEWRKQREAEKIRQAQERAKARLLKSNQVERVHQMKSSHLSDNNAEEDPRASEEREKQIAESRKRAEERVRLRKLEQERQEQNQQPTKQAPSSDVIDEERLKQLDASRKRAQERVRQMKLEKLKNTTQQQESHNQETEHIKIDEKREQFRLRTLQRLQAAKRAAQEEQPEQPDTEVTLVTPIMDPEEAEKERKRQEKRRRRETAERLKRQQAIAEEQQRKERELIEKGLSDFKNMRKEMDRVAKGLQPLNRKEEAPAAPVMFTDEAMQPYETSTGEGDTTGFEIENDQFDGAGEPAATVIQADASPQDGDDLSITIDCDTQSKSIQPTSSGTKSKRKKIPPWKQPPVPILPPEGYAQKAVISPQGGSYMDRFTRSGRTSPTVVVTSVSRSSTATSTGSFSRGGAVGSRLVPTLE